MRVALAVSSYDSRDTLKLTLGEALEAAGGAGARRAASGRSPGGSTGKGNADADESLECGMFRAIVSG